MSQLKKRKKRNSNPVLQCISSLPPNSVCFIKTVVLVYKSCEVRGNHGNLQSNHNKLFHFPVKVGNQSLRRDLGTDGVFLGRRSRNG